MSAARLKSVWHAWPLCPTPSGAVDLLRSRVEDLVDAARCDRMVGGIVVVMAVKLPVFSDPLGNCVGRLQLGVVKHGLQGKLQGHRTVVIVSAKYGVVDLDRAVYRAVQPRLSLTFRGGAAHGICFAAVGTLCLVNAQRPEAALGIQPQHVVVISQKQQSSCVGLHPRVTVTARGRNRDSVSAVIRQLDLAPPNLSACHNVCSSPPFSCDSSCGNHKVSNGERTTRARAASLWPRAVPAPWHCHQ